MNRRRLEERFCYKLSSELRYFKEGVLQRPKEEIISMAYQIDAVITIYEILRELCRDMSQDELRSCIRTPNFLDHCYKYWLKNPDSQMDEMQEVLVKQIRRTVKKAA